MINGKNILIVVLGLIIFFIILNYFFNAKTSNQNFIMSQQQPIVQEVKLIPNPSIPLPINTLETFKNDDMVIYNFSASWCGHCQKFQPIWDEFSKKSKVKAVDVKCDKDENKEICNKYDIPGYPTVLAVINGNTKQYNGARNVEELIKFSESLEDMPPKETINSEDTVIYNFNTVWCGYSKRFQPIWDEFAASLNNTKIKAIDVKCDNPDNNELCGKFDVPGYPSIIIVKGGKPIPYQGNRTVNDLRKAVDLAPVANTGVTIYNFNTEWCGYSKKFQPIWDDFATTMKNTSINVVDVKCDDEKNKDLCNKYEVKGYPSVIIDKNGSIQEYNGPRTVDGLRAAVMDQSKKIHIYNFNTEWCGYSKQFQPIWNTFANSLKNTDNVEVLDVKCDDDKNKDLCKKFNIKGYPTVLILKDGKQKIYDGPRTVDGLKAAIFN